MTELELISGCQKGTPKAQQALYARYSGKVMGICMRYAKRRDEAEDIFQEAFVKIFKNIHKIRESKTLTAWIRQVTVNVAIDNYRKNAKHYGHLTTEYCQESSEDAETILDSLSNQELLTLITKLPAGYQLIFNLYVIEGYNHREIAEKLDISEGTSKSQLFRAKNMLKKMLQAIADSETMRNYEL